MDSDAVTYMTAKLRESRDAAHGRHHASCYLRQADDRTCAGDNKVTVEDGLCAASHADTVDGGDDGLGAPACAHPAKATSLEPLDCDVDFGFALHRLAYRMCDGFLCSALAQPILEILSGAEGPALASEDDDPQRRLGLEPVKDATDVFFHGVSHRVELLGPVEGHLEHVRCWCSEDEMRAHLGHDELGR